MLVKKLDGTIDFKSKKDLGTKFTLTVKCKRSMNPQHMDSPQIEINYAENDKCKKIMAIFNSSGKNGALMASIDWSQTNLGPLSAWSESLITATSICLKSRHPMLIWWGPKLIMIYNDSYSQILGAKHPKAMGQEGLVCWEEIEPVIAPMLQGVMSGGPATWSEEQLLLLERNGYVEETYFTFSFSAIHDETLHVAGVFTATYEVTKSVVDKRRLNFLKDLGRAASATKLKQAYQLIGETLTTITADIPFGILYRFENKRFVRQTYFGLSENHVANPLEIAEGGLWPTVFNSSVIVMEDLIPRFGLIYCQWPEPVQKAIIVPLQISVNEEDLFGLFIAGVNPRLPFGDDYKSFMELTGARISDILGCIQGYEDQFDRAEELSRLDKAKTQFFTNISHEFRTPLSLMLGPLADSLADINNPLSPIQRERQEMIQSNALRLLKLVNNILDFASIEAGRAKLSLTQVDISELTQQICGVFQSMMENAGLQFIVDIKPINQHPYVDVDLWEKIVLNLLSNAFKFTLQGSVTVNLFQEDNNLILTVTDTGVGIPKSEQPKIFQRFHRAENSKGRSFEGSGIGLALVQELIQLHGGEISFNSQVDHGTVFRVTIPLAPPSNFLNTMYEQVPAAFQLTRNSQATVNEVAKWMTVPKHTKQPEAINAPHVLLVDDNVDLRNYILGILSSNYRVSLANDGLEALDIITNDLPDIVLTDVMMPRLDGFGLIKKLRSDAATSRIPVIILSARAGEESKVDGLEIGE